MTTTHTINYRNSICNALTCALGVNVLYLELSHNRASKASFYQSYINVFQLTVYLMRPGDFTEFGAGFMIGNGMLLLAGVVMMVIAWRLRTKP